MNTKHKITIPEPCHENWNEMTPKDNGRFCLSCTKTVIDFTTMLPEEIQHYFISNQNKSICGRFKNTQLDEIIIQIPSRVLYSQTHYHKMFLPALFVAMGTTLFSCADKDGTKQKINKVEIVEDPSTKEAFTKGKALKNDSDPPPPPKIDQIKFIKPSKINCEETVEVSHSDPYTTTGIPVMESYNTIIQYEYPGGLEKFYKLIKASYTIPEQVKNSNGQIIIAAILKKDGHFNDFKTLKALDSESSEEAIRVLKLGAKWMPASENGKVVETQLYFSIVLKDNENDNSKSTVVSVKMSENLKEIENDRSINP